MADNLRVVIAAAGNATRMKSKINKQYMLLRSKPVLAYSLDLFEALELVDRIVVVANPAEVDFCEHEIVKKYAYSKVAAVIPGGTERQDSVWQGLSQLDANTDLVAVHDGARPLVSINLLHNLISAAEEWGAAVPGVAVRDTLKSVDKNGLVVQTLDRSSVRAIQTPQLFRYTEICRAYREAQVQGYRATDDAALFENYIGRVKIVPGEERNIKITTPLDLAIAESLLIDNR